MNNDECILEEQRKIAEDDTHGRKKRHDSSGRRISNHVWALITIANYLRAEKQRRDEEAGEVQLPPDLLLNDARAKY